MPRSERLLDLLQLLRTHRYAVKGEALARELGVSLRTVYRDIATLQGQGAPIEGEAGVGYLLRPGFTLPPLMFSVEELEALVLGVSWVADRADTDLAQSARHLVAKIKAVLPATLRRELEATTLIVGPAAGRVPVDDTLSAALRQAVREGRKLSLEYEDGQGGRSRRTVWPFALGYFDNVLMVIAWCELRSSLRNFRADRMREWTLLSEAYPESRATLLERWRIQEGLEPSDVYW